MQTSLTQALAHVDGPPLLQAENMLWVGEIPTLGAARHAKRPAVIFPDRGESVSYSELERRSSSFAALLGSLNLCKGDCVAYLGRNSDLFLPVLFGAIRAGVVLLPINWRLTAPEIAYQLKDSNAQLLFADPDFLETAASATSALPIVRLISTEVHADQQNLRALLTDPTGALVAKDDSAGATTRREAQQIVLQLYTSGTTGRPKGVQITHAALSLARHAELVSRDLAHLEPGCTILSAMPSFHIGGMSWVLMGLARFGTVVLTADPSANNFLRLCRAYPVSHSFIVPSVIRMIVDELRTRGEVAPKLQGIYYGAMAMDQQLLQEVISRFDCPCVQFFGMTENTGAATILSPQDHDLARPNLLRSVGKPYPGTSFEIRAADRSVLKRGEPGEIWIRSVTVMAGYANLPDKTSEVLVDGWYATGDGGYLDIDGYLYLTDRIKDMIVSGGENVYPAEVEEVLRQHPAVADVAVIGLADERWGERVAAAVELKADQQLESDALLKFARESLASFKCPKDIRFVATLPRTASGKVQRALVRQHWL